MTARSIYVGPWRVDVEVRPAAGRRLVPVAALARLVAVALAEAGAPAPASVGLILTGDADLTALNRTHMGVDGPTDVLSFPLLPPDSFPPHAGRVIGDATGTPDAPFALPPRSRPHLGDVVVSVGRAIAQAEAGRGGQTGDVRRSPADELRLLVVHGVLHICGWDHAGSVEGTAMRFLERRLLAV